MPEQQPNLPGVVPPRVATNDPDILEAYHRLCGITDAKQTVDGIFNQMKMPGLRLASDALASEIHEDRLRLFIHGQRLVAKAGIAGQFVMTGFRFERAANELVVDIRSLVEIDEELATAKKGGRA